MRYFDMRLFFLTIPKPLKQYTLFKKEYPFRSYKCVACVHGVCFSLNDIGGVASSFLWLSSGGDRGSRMLFAGERGGGGNATIAKSFKWPDT